MFTPMVIFVLEQSIHEHAVMTYIYEHAVIIYVYQHVVIT